MHTAFEATFSLLLEHLCSMLNAQCSMLNAESRPDTAAMSEVHAENRDQMHRPLSAANAHKTQSNKHP
jgi:hypothetical protein